MPDIPTVPMKPVVHDPKTMTLQERLEAFIVDFALLMAGWVINGPKDLIPYDRDQLAVAMIAATSAYARTQPDYDLDMDITQIVTLGAHAYGEATKASMVALMNEVSETSEVDEDEDIGEPEEAIQENTEGDPNSEIPSDGAENR